MSTLTSFRQRRREGVVQEALRERHQEEQDHRDVSAAQRGEGRRGRRVAARARRTQHTQLQELIFTAYHIKQSRAYYQLVVISV